MLKMRMTIGDEGVSHDPYGWSEMVLETDNVILTLHAGLGVWFKVEGKCDPGFEHVLYEGDGAVQEWIDATGLTPYQFHRAYHRVHGLNYASGILN